MMEVCRRNDYNNSSSNSHHQATQQAPPLVANFVPSSNGNVTFTINNQLTNQVQRLVRERASGYDNLVIYILLYIYTICIYLTFFVFVYLQYQLYNGRSMGRQYSSTARADPFQHQLVSSILCPPGYQGMGSPAKHVTVVAQQPPQLQIQPPIISQQVAAQQQYVPVSMVEPNGRQMLLTVSFSHIYQIISHYTTLSYFTRKYVGNDVFSHIDTIEVRFVIYIFRKQCILLNIFNEI